MQCEQKFVYHVIVLIPSWILFFLAIFISSSSFVTYISVCGIAWFPFCYVATNSTLEDPNSFTITALVVRTRIIAKMATCEKQISHWSSKDHWSYFIIIIIYSRVFVYCNFDRCRSAVYCCDQVFIKTHSWKYWMCLMLIPNKD